MNARFAIEFLLRFLSGVNHVRINEVSNYHL